MVRGEELLLIACRCFDQIGFVCSAFRSIYLNFEYAGYHNQAHSNNWCITTNS